MILRWGPDWREKMGERGAPMAMAAALRHVEGQWMARERFKMGL